MLAVQKIIALPCYMVMVPALLLGLVPVSQVLAAPLEIPMPLSFSLPLATVLVSALHRDPVPLLLPYRFILSAMLRFPPLAEHANVHLLMGEASDYAASVLVPACVQPNMELGTVPSSLSVLLGNVMVLTDGPAGLAPLLLALPEAEVRRSARLVRLVRLPPPKV